MEQDSKEKSHDVYNEELIKEEQKPCCCEHDASHQGGLLEKPRGESLPKCHESVRPVDIAPESNDATVINPDPSSTNEGNVHIYCVKCGAENLSSSSFCEKCGNKLVVPFVGSAPSAKAANGPTPPGDATGQSTQVDSNYTSSCVVDEAVQELVGENKAYYLRKFEMIKEQGKTGSWNWSAFFFAPFWLFYRKMYAYGAAMIGAVALLGILHLPFISLALNLALYVFVGISGNYMYLQSLETKAKQANAFQEPQRSQFINQHAGVNLAAVLGLLFAYCIFAWLVTSFAGSFYYLY